MKVLIIGSGGREHALGWKFKNSPLVTKLYFAPGNAGTQQIGINVEIAYENITELLRFAKKEGIDLTVVGPERPLVLGITDVFRKNGLKIVGPSKKASQIEGSKIFAKQLMKKYSIPCADYKVFDDFYSAKQYLTKVDYPLVIKADGLCAGKGVSVCKTKRQALIFLKKLMLDKIFGYSGNKVIIEDCLFGQEISYIVVTDGKNFLSFPPVQDYKRLKDNDKGPNTGGMGSCSPVPFVDKKTKIEIENKIIKPIIKAMEQEGCPYQGILYAGLILTKDGPKVLEFNCRLGDPETQSLMLLIKNDLLPVFLATTDQTINKHKIYFQTGTSICVILASKGYPEDYEKGKTIFGLEKIKKDNTVIFHSGTTFKDNKIVTNGGRVLGVTSYGRDFKEAYNEVYRIIKKKNVWFENMIYRKDIGKKLFK